MRDLKGVVAAKDENVQEKNASLSLGEGAMAERSREPIHCQ